MRHGLLLLLCMVFVVCSDAAQAQISFDNMRLATPVKPLDDAADGDEVSSDTYHSPAGARARRRAIRHQRNQLEYGVGLMGTVTSFNDSWIKTSGGDNSIGLSATAYIYHTYTKGKFSLTSKFDAKFGYNRMNLELVADGVTTKKATWFKYQDEFQISTSPAYAISRDWALASIIRFRSQFAHGYISRSQQKLEERKSSFLAPGYFDASLGFTYKSPDKKWPFIVNISPIAISGTFVDNRIVHENVWGGKTGWLTYGLTASDKRARWEGGSSVQVDFDRKFGRKEIIRYRTTLYSFMGWLSYFGKDKKYRSVDEYEGALAAWNTGGEVGNKPMLAVHPTVRWENTLDIKATRFLTTSVYFQLYYNRAQHYHLQTQLLLSVGVTYTFDNHRAEKEAAAAAAAAKSKGGVI